MMAHRAAGLVISLCMISAATAASPGHVAQTGDALKKMCLGADKVKALSMMCHSYLNGYIDAALHHGHGKRFCLASGDKERLPTLAVTWLDAHPDYLRKSAPEALGTLLAENFPCRK